MTYTWIGMDCIFRVSLFLLLLQVHIFEGTYATIVDRKTAFDLFPGAELPRSNECQIRNSKPVRSLPSLEIHRLLAGWKRIQYGKWDDDYGSVELT